MAQKLLPVLNTLAEEAQAFLLALLQPEDGDLDARHVCTRNVLAYCTEQGSCPRHVRTELLCDGREIRVRNLKRLISEP